MYNSLTCVKAAAEGSASSNWPATHEEDCDTAHALTKGVQADSLPTAAHTPQCAQDPAEKAELIDEILDILEVLRLSRLLCMDLIRAIAMRIILGLGADPHVSQALRHPTAPSETSLLLPLVLGQQLLCTMCHVLKAAWHDSAWSLTLRECLGCGG